MKLCHKSLPRRRVIEFACAILEDSPHFPLPPSQERWWCACAPVRGGRAWLAGALFRQSNQSRSAESDRWNIQPVTVRQASQETRRCVFFVLSVLPSLYPGKIQWARMLVFDSPRLLIHADKTQSSIAVDWTAPLEHWRWNNKGFPILMCGDYRLGARYW